MKTLITSLLILTIWLILPLAAFELVTTETEQRVVDDTGAVVATYPLSLTLVHFEPWDTEVWSGWGIITGPDWWAASLYVNGQAGEPSPPSWAWRFISHELHIVGESWELPESFIDSVEVGPSTVTAIVRKFSEQAKWQDHEQTTYVFNRKLPEPQPEPEPGQFDVDISLVVNLRFETKSDVTYDVQAWDDDHETWRTIQSVPGTGSAVDAQVERTADAAILRVVQR